MSSGKWKAEERKLLVLVNKWLENKEKEGKVLKWHTWPVRLEVPWMGMNCSAKPIKERK